MSTEILAGPLGELRAVSTAGGGTALTSTATRTVLPRAAKMMTLTARNFVGAAVAQVNVNPWLTIFKTTDAGLTLTDYSDNAQDGDAATDVTLSSLDTAANLDFLYVGSHLPFSGVVVDVDAANGTASVLTVKYRKSDSTWADISATDGTTSGGASLAIDGNVTWTVPTDWLMAAVKDTIDTEAQNLGILTQPMFWTRWEFSAALDSTTTLNSMISINRSTAYWELVEGQGIEEAVTVGPGGIISVTHKTDAGTGNLIINVATRQNGRFG